MAARAVAIPHATFNCGLYQRRLLERDGGADALRLSAMFLAFELAPRRPVFGAPGAAFG